MVFYILIAILNGMVNVVNKIVNLHATKSLGTVNGTLINYVEGTIISLAMVFLLGRNRLDAITNGKTIPLVFTLGGVFGLIAMVLILNGMARVRISYSTVIVLAGQLGAGFVLDSIAAGKIIPLKIAGLVLVAAGIFFDQIIENSRFQKSSAKKS